MRPEILAPVGGQEQLLAAVRSGANAVYLGSKNFNARRNAENFDEPSLAQTVQYCHGRGVAVHITLNTLVTDAEQERLIAEIALIAQSGADAVIIQDLGVAKLVRRCCPTLPMHASTQLSVHNVAGALLLRELGFARLVLARELSAAEIREIKEKSGLEVEIFVHGALCMSMSGSCYLSSLLGERSGNRGLCAQPCRLDFTAPDGRPFALSLKDLSLMERMDEVVSLGVDSLKIEGRMKRPEYVAAAVTACKQALEGVQPDMERLQAVFSRGGFTDGYFAGQRTTQMFGYRTREDVTAAAGVLGELAGLYRGENPVVPVDITFAATADAPCVLTLTDGTHTLTVRGDTPQTAQNRPTDEALVRRGVEKLGGTPFFLRGLSVALAPGIMVPMSMMNTMRKEAAEKLLALRETAVPHAFAPPPPAASKPKQKVGTLGLKIRLESYPQLTPTVKSAAQMITLPLNELYSHQELLAELGDRLAAEVPLLVFPQDEADVVEKLAELKKQGLQTAVAGSQGGIGLIKTAGLSCGGDYSLNILNSTALGAYEAMGLAAATLSFENSMKSARQMEANIPVGVIGYGYLPVMTFRNCPARTAKGCGDCNGTTYITDRRGDRFPLLCRQKAYTQLLNPVPLYLGDKQSTLHGLSFAMLYFTVESPAAVEELLGLWQSGAAYPGRRTGGLYYRELL